VVRGISLARFCGIPPDVPAIRDRNARQAGRDQFLAEEKAEKEKEKEIWHWCDPAARNLRAAGTRSQQISQTQNLPRARPVRPENRPLQGKNAALFIKNHAALVMGCRGRPQEC